MLQFPPAERVTRLGSTIAPLMERLHREVRPNPDLPVIPLGVGDPDHGTPDPVVAELIARVQDPKNHHYPLQRGLPEMLRAVAEWYHDRYDVTLDPATEVLYLAGIKEGIALTPVTFCNPGDVVLIPDPAWTGYQAGAALAGADVHFLPLVAENNFLPDLDAIPEDIARRAKILFLNYPCNPTGAIAPEGFLREAVEFCRRHEILFCQDLAYSEIVFDGQRQPSVLEIEGAREVAIEFFSPSKNFNMTGWRIGFAVGRADVLATLYKVRQQIDTGVFMPIQYAVTSAFLTQPEWPMRMRALYETRRQVFLHELGDIARHASRPAGTFYVWLRVPQGYTSFAFTEALLDRCSLLVVPGIAFGTRGDDYVRLAMTVEEDQLREAARRLRESGLYG